MDGNCQFHQVHSQTLDDLKKRLESVEQRTQTHAIDMASTDARLKYISEKVDNVNEKLSMLSISIEALKEKPVRRYDHVVTTLITAVLMFALFKIGLVAR